MSTSIDSLLRAVARTPGVEVPLPALAPGTLVDDTFEVLGELGRGGMGVVYRAHDRRLDREVALKLMRPDRWAHVPRAQLAALLAREARATARLSHPSIVALHQTGEHDGAPYLVLALLRGDSLAAALRRPPPIAIAIARMRQVADAVAHAHAQGVLHRDLKPHNVWLGDDGHVWVLDFGLAALHDAGAGEPAAALSRAGTPAYMAPEQRDGRPQDARTDVWALGLLLFHAVTAHEPPPLATAADLDGAAWAADLARLPPAIAAIVRDAVRWDPAARTPTAAGFAARLAALDPAALAPPRRSRARWLAAAGLAVAASAAAVLVLVTRRDDTTPPPPPPIAFSIAVPPTEPFATFQTAGVAVSPDGSAVVFVGAPAVAGTGASQLYLRRLDRDAAEPLPGTEDAEGPAFSPDGASLAFAKDGALRVLPLAGGPAVAIADVHAGTRGVGWLPDGRLVVSPSWFSGLAIAAPGRPLAPLTTLAAGEKSHRHPHVLPGGRTVLFVVGTEDGDSFDDAAIEAVDVATGTRTPVTTGGAPCFVPPSTLLVPRAGRLIALPFDPRTATVTGPPRPVVDDVVTAPGNGAPLYDTRGGTLAYFAGGPALFDTDVVRLDAAGATTRLDVPAGATTSVRAPTTDQLLVRVDAANATIWLHDLARGTRTRVSQRRDVDHAVLAPDGAHVYAVVTRGARASIERLRADGTGTAEILLDGRNPANLDLSRDGRTLVFDEIDPARGTADLYVLDPTGPAPAAAPRRIVGGPEHETQPALSPDGRWLAFTSSTSGTNQVYLQAYPQAGLRRQVSARGGRWPRWSPDGRTLYFRDGADVLAVAVDLGPGGDAVLGPPQVRHTLADVADPARRTFDVTPTGALVTVVRPPGWHPADRLRIVRHWRADRDR